MSKFDPAHCYYADNARESRLFLEQHGIGADIKDGLVFLSGHSPFLRRLIHKWPDFCRRLAHTVAEDLLEDLCNHPQTSEDNQTALMRDLRIRRGHLALLVAWMDITGQWDLRAVCKALSVFADYALQRSLSHLMSLARERTPALANQTIEQSGYFLLAMGKLGAQELNYSSDIDLIALFDGEVFPGHFTDAQAFWVRLTKDLVRILEQRTADGYVFRVDLRLRPDAGSTPVALSTVAADAYYQSTALTWERAAMIKARAVAGDGQAAQEFLQQLHHFVWRRSVDYGVLQDIHMIKDQVHRHNRQTEPRVKGYNVKLGPGGIREIEFFTQIHQLLAGGRDAAVRDRSTLDALKALSQSGRIAPNVRDDMTRAYDFLRMVEHRLQMIDDQQTQVLPESDEVLARLISFCGFTDTDIFAHTLLTYLSHVQGHYDQLLPDPANQKETIPDLVQEAFKDADQAMRLIMAWLNGRYRSVRTERARRTLSELMPDLIQRLKATGTPDEALIRFDGFLQKLPAGVQLFSLFRAQPAFMGLMIRIMAAAPALGDMLARQPKQFDLVLEPDFFRPLPAPQSLAPDLEGTIGAARSYEELLGLFRRWAADRKFQVGVHILESLTAPGQAARALSHIADVCLPILLRCVQHDYARRYGTFPGGDLACLALGSYGGRDMTFRSDIDLVFIYTTDGITEASDGPRAVSAAKYFSGLAQALVTALTVLTKDGRLYEVDTRLRPNGLQGPIAVHEQTFHTYYRDEAWTWEHLAMMRARPVLGAQPFRQRLMNVVRSCATKPCSPADLTTALALMRERLGHRFAPSGLWDVKRQPGGLLDLEFIAQGLSLLHGAQDRAMIAPSTTAVLARAAELGVMPQAEAEILIRAHDTLLSAHSVLRLCAGDRLEEDAFTEELRAILAKALGVDTFADARKCLKIAQSLVQSSFQALYSF